MQQLSHNGVNPRRSVLPADVNKVRIIGRLCDCHIITYVTLAPMSHYHQCHIKCHIGTCVTLSPVSHCHLFHIGTCVTLSHFTCHIGSCITLSPVSHHHLCHIITCVTFSHITCHISSNLCDCHPTTVPTPGQLQHLDSTLRHPSIFHCFMHFHFCLDLPQLVQNVGGVLTVAPVTLLIRASRCGMNTLIDTLEICPYV